MTPTEPIRIEINPGHGIFSPRQLGHIHLLAMMNTIDQAIPPRPKTERIVEDKPTIPLKQRRKMLARKKRK